MQSVTFDSLKATSQPMASTKQEMAYRLGQMQFYQPNFEQAATLTSHTSQPQVMNRLAHNWLTAGLSLRPMEPGHLQNVHPDQLHFIPMGQLPAISTFANKQLLDCALLDAELTSYGDRELPYPSSMRPPSSISPMQPSPATTYEHELDVQNVACGMSSFSDSEDGSTGSSPRCPSSDLENDVFEDTNYWFDDLQDGDFDPSVSFAMPPGEEESKCDNIEDVIAMILGNSDTLESLDTFASPTARLNMMNMLQDQLTHSEKIQCQLPVSAGSPPAYSTSTCSVVPQLQSSMPIAYGSSQRSQCKSPISSSPLLRDALTSNLSPSSISLSSQPGSPEMVIPSMDGFESSQKKSQMKPKRRQPRPMKETSIMPPQLGASGSASLWEFILELLSDSTYSQFIRWVDYPMGRFKIYDSQVVAALWGKHKNRTNMNFDKMSRAMRYYYGKNILEKGPDGGRLEYEFRPGSQWQRYVPRNLNNQNFTAISPNLYPSEEREGHARVSRRRSSRAPLRSSSPY